MKALVYTQPNEVQWLDQPEPSLDAGEVILQIDAVGICGSDMHAYHGHDPRRKPGLILGHEFSGTVVQSASAAFAVGARVTGNPLITCGTCLYCTAGRDNLCAHRTMVGMTRPGAFAQYMSIPASTLIPIPDGMSALHAALTEPAATALHAIHLSQKMLLRPLESSKVLILGGGAIGMFAALLLAQYDTAEIHLAEVNALRRASIAEHTRAQVFDPREQNSAQAAFDFVIDAVGSKITRNTALNAVMPAGVVMHIGLQDWASEIDMRKLTLAEISLLGSYTYSQNDLRQTLHLLHSGALGELNWVQTMSLENGAEAFAQLDKGKIASAKVVLLN